MKECLRKHLVCPKCKGKFKDKVFKDENEDVIYGILFCDVCNDWYPISNSIPRILPPFLWPRDEFIREYGLYIKRVLNREEKKVTTNESQLQDIKKNTQDSFGFEWELYARFGWDEPEYDIEKESSTFEYKSILTSEDLKGELALDAGCGNGRYSYWAAKKGASDVIAVDISSAVEVCKENTKDFANIHVIQGDVLNLPFADNVFDRVFSIGVLMHTGNPQGALKSLFRVTKYGGTTSAHFYQKKNIIYEIIDRKIRKHTIKWPRTKLLKLTNILYKLSIILEKLRILKIVTSFIRIDNHPHCIFDWYSAPIAEHMTYKEILPWFKIADYKILSDRKDKDPSFLMKILLKIHPRDAIIVKGEKFKPDYE